jgi:hypothetical protein
MAFEGKVSKKSDALKSFHELVAILPNELLSNNPLLIQSIYSNLLLTRQKKAKNTTDWLSLALAKRGGAQPFLWDIYVNDTYAVATNGFALHAMVKQEELPVGYINVKGEPLTLDYEYPDVNRVLPDMNSPDWKDLSNAVISYGFSGKTTYVKIDNAAVDINYYDAGMANPIPFTDYLISGDKISFKNIYGYIALIVKLNIKEDTL